MKRELTKQELLDQYIHSVKALLPPDRMDDIAAEISSNPQSLMEDRASQLGRDLCLEELSAILKRYGHPGVVAGRCADRPVRGLIGPQLFPFYWSTLRAIVGVWVLVRVIGALLTFHGPRPSARSPGASAGTMVWGLLIDAGVTAVFAAWECLELPIPRPEHWKPEDLPPGPASDPTV